MFRDPLGTLRLADHRMQCSYGGDGSRVAFNPRQPRVSKRGGWLGASDDQRRDV